MNQKSVHNHYILLEKEQKKKIREEEKADGISLEHTHLMTLSQTLLNDSKREDSDKRQRKRLQRQLKCERIQWKHFLRARRGRVNKNKRNASVPLALKLLLT